MPNLRPATVPLIEQVTMNPLLLEENSQQLFQACLTHVIQHERAETLMSATNEDEMRRGDSSDFWGDPNDPDDYRNYLRPYVVVNGVLQIPVMGVLLSRFPWQLGRWATGYKYIEMAFKRGLMDMGVSAIALVVDSPGGEVTECFELVDKIYEWRAQKPIRAFSANRAYSAAFAIYSAAESGVVTRSGETGSVGVVTAHVEWSEYMSKMGIKVTYVFAGKHKVDGNPYEALSPEAKKRVQARIDKIYGVFVSTVARNRGMEEDKVRATEALTYDAEDSMAIGFADRIGSLEEELVVFATEATEGDEYMATPAQPNVTGKKTGGEDQATGISQEDFDAGVTSARAEGETAGATAERTRISAILGSEEAKTRPAAAMNVAMRTGMSVTEAAEFLKAMPEEKQAASQTPDSAATTTTTTNKPKAGATHFDQFMERTTNPDISATTDANDDGTSDDEADTSNSILASYGAAAGIRPTKK